MLLLESRHFACSPSLCGDIFHGHMHSPYEIGGNQGPLHLLNVMKALYSAEILCTQDGEYPVL